MERLNKKGAISIVGVFIITIFIIVLTGFSSLIYKLYLNNEIQGILDNSGVISLRYAADDTKWRDEIIEVDEEKAKTKFYELVEKEVSNLGGINDFHLRKVRVYDKDEVKRIGISPGGGKDQYFIESVAVVKYPVYNIVDTVLSDSHIYYNFFENNLNTEIVVGEVGDGEAEIIIRSVSRLVLR